MILDLARVANVRLPQVDTELRRFLSLEFSQVSEPMALGARVPELVVRYDDTLSLHHFRGRANIGGVVWEMDGKVFLSDGAMALCEMPDSAADGNCEIRVHPDFKAGRFYYEVLLPFFKRHLLAAGCAFLHASGWARPNGATVVSAWGGTGKTNRMIRELLSGAEYFGDDLVIVRRDGFVVPFARRINLFGYNAQAIAGAGGTVGAAWRARIVVARSLSRVATLLVPRHRAYIISLEKRATQRLLSCAELGSRAGTEAVKAGTVQFLRGQGGAEATAVNLSATNVEWLLVALLANLRTEFASQQATANMMSALLGRGVEDVIGEKDESVIRSFLETAILP